MIKSIPFARRGNLTPDERWLVTLRHVVVIGDRPHHPPVPR
jgi:hypothetical protein